MQQFKKKEFTNKKVCHSRESGNPGGEFTRLVFNLIVKRKSGYDDDHVKKLSFSRKRECVTEQLADTLDLEGKQHPFDTGIWLISFQMDRIIQIV